MSERTCYVCDAAAKYEWRLSDTSWFEKEVRPQKGNKHSVDLCETCYAALPESDKATCTAL